MAMNHGQTRNYTAGPLHYGGSGKMVNIVKSCKNTKMDQMVAINVESDIMLTSYDPANYSEDYI